MIYGIRPTSPDGRNMFPMNTGKYSSWNRRWFSNATNDESPGEVYPCRYAAVKDLLSSKKGINKRSCKRSAPEIEDILKLAPRLVKFQTEARTEYRMRLAKVGAISFAPAEKWKTPQFPIIGQFIGHDVLRPDSIPGKTFLYSRMLNAFFRADSRLDRESVRLEAATGDKYSGCAVEVNPAKSEVGDLVGALRIVREGFASSCNVLPASC